VALSREKANGGNDTQPFPLSIVENWLMCIGGPELVFDGPVTKH